MKKDAKEHESDDKKKREEVDIRNQADNLVFQSEKQLKEFEGKLPPDMKAKIQTAIDKLKEAQKSNNVTDMKSAIDGLNQVWNEASTQMYSQATGGQQPGAEQQAPGEGEQPKTEEQKVENADFEVIDDKEKK
jgi:molecular chaperone DnaK